MIADESKLLVASPELFRDRFEIDVHTGTEAIAIDRAQRTLTLTLRDVASGATRTAAYDALVLAPGAAPIRPPLPGIARPGVFAVRSIRHAELPRDRAIWCCCGVGQRAHYATRFLRQCDYDAANLSGGYTTYRALHDAGIVG